MHHGAGTADAPSPLLLFDWRQYMSAFEKLGKPVLAINTLTFWHALRTNGISDRISGFGSLLEEF